MYRKRDNELVERAQGILNDESTNEATREVMNSLLASYKDNTFKDWDDRHGMYADTVSHMVNDMGFQDKELAEKMANEHPTLQQSFMRMCVKFIKMMSEKTCWDGRNEASVRLAKKMMDAVGDDTGLPFI